ncbi:DNA/RNA nuclease SfsA [Plebeiibacterium sediminum]|uniref:Sugar fermentation stimulation protein homolog n=1 Tax=Plebeiibacterium sediminum TaxID=2992112 RepID=A0AAE3M7X9_9BACT|nr:DNA/RNA nuclease SfsA [Plebeiobacterium sediminum]MCW3788824.1 DNA/RNA nuclease SfsA [Plebeiobacterium sediminum]
MKFKSKLVPGKLIRRYKRFLTDVELEDGSTVIAHCTNSGSMKTCIEEGAPVYLTQHNDPKRKTQFTWEMIFINNHWIGINTSVPNILVYEAVRDQIIPQLNMYTNVKREVKFGDSRFDVFAENEAEKCFIEVKNVTLREGNKATFPDAVTTRGLKHLNTLIEVKKAGMRAVMFYVIQRQDIESFSPAKDIDPKYAEGLKEAINNGVEVIPYMANVTPEKIELLKEIPFYI